MGGPTIARRGPRSCISSVVDFERTSTVHQPTEVANDDYTSNVSIDELRRDYFANYKRSTGLPIHKFRNYVVNSINSYNVVIIEGDTGCGKTTQVPTYILEEAILDRPQPNGRAPVIYVTQPRRIAARSIARRVCEEHGWELGTIVGYQVGLEKVMGPQTVLVFCTAGVLLQKLIQDKSLKSYTHIIIDEVHERDSETDLLLMMVKTLMRKEMSFFRLIVMSATIDLNKLKNYFNFRTNYGHKATVTPSICKIVNAPNPDRIQTLYFEDFRAAYQLSEQPPAFDQLVPDLHDECLKAAVRIIVDIIPNIDTFSESTQTTLVFLPGMAEISKLHRMLMKSDHLDIIPLHSCLSVVDQARVFQPATPGSRKVILATNIAESSITVPDAGFIIDFCLTKVLRKDEVTRFPCLKLEWSSKDKCIQRTGRTGRCCPGKVFRMITRGLFETFSDYATPELMIAPLELSVLRVKNFQMGDVQNLLRSVLDPPPNPEIRTAVLELKQIGALSSTCDGELKDMDGDLTELGKVISILPIDVHLSKLIAMAHVLDVLEDAIIVASCLSTNRSVVKHLYGNVLESYKNKLKWSNGSNSDLFVCLDVYKNYIQYKDEQNKSQAWLDQYCHHYNLDEKKLYEVSALVEELRLRLEGINIRSFDQPNRERDRNEDELMLKVAFCASFYPNYFLTKDIDVRDIDRAMGGLDPKKTVMVYNFPVNQVPLYRSLVLGQVMPKVCNHIDYIADCSTAFLVIHDDNKMKEDTSTLQAIGVEGVVESAPDISTSVYMAIKLSECQERICIREYKEEAAFDRMQHYKELRRVVADSSNRLAPSMMKLITGRRPDNRGLTEGTDAEFQEYVSTHNYVEVEFNEEQDRADIIALEKLERAEMDARMRGKNLDEDEVDHPIFKNETRAVRGPMSPIRIGFRSILEKSKSYSVSIDNHSVNSILLNPDYAKERRQLLVAVSLSQTEKSKLKARDTTLMPNIRGLASLMGLMFAQYYRVVYNEQLKCLAGAVFGIGWDQQDRPIDKTYEVELSFDVHITKDDIELINRARRLISELTRFIDVSNPGAPRAEQQDKLRSIIMLLIRKKRFPLNEINLTTIDWDEEEFVMDKHNVPKEQFIRLEEGQTRAFLPLAELTKSFGEMEMYQATRDNLQLMNAIELRQAKPPMGGIRCLLCGGGQGSVFLMAHKIVEHINGDDHIEKLKLFEIFEERAKLREQQFAPSNPRLA